MQETEWVRCPGTVYDIDIKYTAPDGAPIAASWVLLQFGKLIDDLELPHIRFHNLRHPYVKPTTKVI